jgi:hypothetical protein
LRVDVTTHSRNGRGAQASRHCCARFARLEAGGTKNEETKEFKKKAPEAIRRSVNTGLSYGDEA